MTDGIERYGALSSLEWTHGRNTLKGRRLVRERPVRPGPHLPQAPLLTPGVTSDPSETPNNPFAEP